MAAAPRLLLASAALILAALLAASPAAAARGNHKIPGDFSGARDVTVTTRADSGPGSLRAAINGAARGETVQIRFAADVRGQITLSAPLAVSDVKVSIEGPGADELRISGEDAHRIFVVGADSVFWLYGVTLAHGRDVGAKSPDEAAGGPGEGGAILNRGQTWLGNVRLTANSAIGGGSWHGPAGAGRGGAIYNTGGLTTLDCLFSDNLAHGGEEHDPHYGSNRLTGGPAAGGAIFNQGHLEIEDSEFRTNVASGGDGYFFFALFGVGTAGGDASGGGVFDGKDSAGLRIVGSTLAGNLAQGGAAGVGHKRFKDGDALGGAVFSASSEVAVIRSTVTANSTELGKERGTDEVGELGAGGLELRGGGVLRSDTILGNAGIADVRTGTAASTGNTILGSCAGAGLRSAGFNLERLNGCGLSAATDLHNTDPKLDGLGDHGGPTRTMPVTEASPALDAGHAAEDIDQRDKPRPVRLTDKPLPPGGNAADIGAFELQKIARVKYTLEPEEIEFGSVPVATTSKYHQVELTNSGDLAFKVGNVALGGEDADEFAISSQSCAGVVLNPGDKCRVRVRFTPEENGRRKADLFIHAEAPVGTLTVFLSGSGS